MLLGWEVPREGAALDGSTPTPLAHVPGLSAGLDGRSFGVTWQSDGGLEMGMLHANGQSRSGVACFRAGDVIGCTIDQDELVPYLRFYLNGAQVLPPVQIAQSSQQLRAPTVGQPAATSASPGIACQNPVYCLFPVVSMYSSRKKPQMRVRFNFRGAFRFPIPGFEPYGAPI
ncbi:hypothetical protein PINS_up015002 [Pythium insidiosum]|nr:hypothetical protein PINS_up015002 [Pythium insidiosum]